MNILLDTHIWLWALLDKARITKSLAAALENPDNQLWLSSISIWEAMILFQTGRIELNSDPALWIRQALARGFIVEAPLTHEIALHSRLIDLPHKDRADRFIAATALVHGLTLATSDEHLLRCRTFRTLGNR